MSPKFSRLRHAAVLGVSLIALAACSPSPQPAAKPPQSQGTAAVQTPKPTSSGYAPAAEGLRVYYEVYGQGEPIVV